MYAFWQCSQEHPTLNNTYQGNSLRGFENKSVRAFQFVSICSLFSNRHRAVASGRWGAGEARAPQFFADQLTLPQWGGGGHIMPITLPCALPEFQP